MSGTSIDLAAISAGDEVAWLDGYRSATTARVARLTRTQIVCTYEIAGRTFEQRWYRLDGSRVGNRFEFLLDPRDPLVIEAQHVMTYERARYAIEHAQLDAGRLKTGQEVLDLLNKIQSIVHHAVYTIERRERGGS